MTDTFSPMSPQPLAFYDPGSCSWRTSQGTSLWGEPTLLERLPDWGMTRGGELFARPMPVRLTAVRGSSSSQLLPTSRATDGSKGGPGQVNGRGVADSLPGVAPLLRGGADATPAPSPTRLSPGLLPTPTADHSRGLPQPGTDYQSLPNVAVSLLPTPTARDWKDGAHCPNVPTNGLLGREVWALLPTPAVNDMGRGKTPQQWDEWTAKMQASHSNGNGHGKSLEIEAQRLLPTPTAHQHPAAETRDPHQRKASSHQTELSDVVRAGFPTSDPTLPLLPDGSTSSDDQPLLPLNLDGTTDPD